jgi:hypothetical protein
VATYSLNACANPDRTWVETEAMGSLNIR